MFQTAIIILSLAYIIGLLSTVVPWGGYIMLTLGAGTAIAIPYFWRGGPQRWVWFIAGIVGFLATFYFHAQVPQAGLNDISKFVPTDAENIKEEVVTIWGEVISTPRVTRSQRAQFWLEATQLNPIVSPNIETAQNNHDPLAGDRGVTGKLYVTVPLLQATGLYPGETITVTGKLYQPKPPSNPGGFNFQAYLAKEGCFAGLVGRQVRIPAQEEPKWGWWMVRQKIIRSQVFGLGVPAGPLVSAMVIGNRAVDLPYDIQDDFKQIGLTHALAASGFQVSLILTLVLSLCKRFSEKIQFICGSTSLLVFLGLTGCQASIVRAAIMGFFGILIALLIKRKSKPLALLLLSATLMLLFNPNWIWDLGFQLSFLATLGLLVTEPSIAKKLDWLPPVIASSIAVSLAAFIWTIPLQIYTFGLISPYTLLVNVLVAPLISIISLGGFISAIAALIHSATGSGLAQLLYYPTQGLITIAHFFSKLPGNAVAVGTISTVQMVSLYGVIGLFLLLGSQRSPEIGKKDHLKAKVKSKKLREQLIAKLNIIVRSWWFATLIAVAIVIIPIWQSKVSLFKVTVLSASGDPVLVIQEREKVVLVNSGNENTARFTILPFFQKQGVNQIDWAIATDPKLDIKSGWLQILERMRVKNFHDNTSKKNSEPTKQIIINGVQADQGSYQSLTVGQPIEMGSAKLELIKAQPTVVELQISGQTWLWLGDFPPDQQSRLVKTADLPHPDVLWWSGKRLREELLGLLQPKIAIAASSPIDPETKTLLQLKQIQLYSSSQDGAIQWTPGSGFETTLDTSENDTSLL